MKRLALICHYLIYLLGVFIMVLGLSAFDLDLSFWGKLFGFFMQCLPGIGLILINYFLRKQELILGILLIGMAIFFFVFFRLYHNISDTWLTILTVDIPPLACGIIFIISRNRYSKA
ncbi:MAG: hypothetical protein JXB08_05055 [Bacilli bacterium]|nr:hypothetical protein [Bacilli bacterium]MBN2877451.1 hypothetical protein [Bacilli bacterium]